MMCNGNPNPGLCYPSTPHHLFVDVLLVRTYVDETEEFDLPAELVLESYALTIGVSGSGNDLIE
jgi:hypothetical protein